MRSLIFALMNVPKKKMLKIVALFYLQVTPMASIHKYSFASSVPQLVSVKLTEDVNQWSSSHDKQYCDMGTAEKMATGRNSSFREFQRNKTPVTVEWKNVFLTTTDGKSILKDLSGEVGAGELTAIIGPSGAGKSTLLNVLSGFTRQKVSGQILVNGSRRNMQVFRKLSCYIMQEDHLFPHLTVRESIYSAASLKIPTTVSKEEKKLAVNECMRSLGLLDCQDTKTRQLSGGQRKRLHIAQELVSNPPLIFIDEPTSGLDSSSCLQCVQLLKSLANEGRTVVCSIHQPSTRIFEIFDKLYVLAEGYCVYRGLTGHLVPFLERQNLSCPLYHNPSDFVIELASSGHGSRMLMLKKAVDMEETPILDQSFVGGKEEDDFLDSSLCCMQDSLDERTLLLEEDLQLQGVHCSGYATSSFNQFRVLCHRSLICTLREPISTWIRFISHVVFGLLLGTLYLGIGNDGSKVYENAAYLFLSILFLNSTALMGPVLVFPMEKNIFAREIMNHWYSTKMYFLAKAVVEIPFQVLFSVTYCCITYWMTSQPCDLFRFGLFLLSCIMTSLVSQELGLVVGASSKVQNAVFLSAVLSIPILLFCGFFIKLKAIPSGLKWLSYLSYLRYSYQSLLLVMYSMDRPPLICNNDYCPFPEPGDFLNTFDMGDGRLYLDYSALCAFLLAYGLIAYFILRYRKDLGR